RMTPDMLLGVDPNHRAYVAPRLQMTDDGMLRATTKTGLAVTQMGPPKKKSNAGVVAAIMGAVLVIGGAGAAVAISKKSQSDAEKAAASRPEPPPTIKSVIVTERIAAEVVTKSFDLIVAAPPEAVVTIDDQPATLAGDKLTISGSPGATKRVKVALGDQVQEQTVAITEGGLIPPRLELKKLATGGGHAVAAKPGAAPAAEKPGAAAAKPDAPKPAKKPQVETGMDEFK
ncbi:MAG TPA: hypothetical protein VNG33_03010, partial [Polyangiaceae bacterium]|nr:hypothetical protein [Polyangiaceae bacterium]